MMRKLTAYERLQKEYNETRKPIVQDCEGCQYVVDSQFCRCYINPEALWTNKKWCVRCSTLVPVLEKKSSTKSRKRSIYDTIIWVPRNRAEEFGTDMTKKMANPLKVSKRKHRR